MAGSMNKLATLFSACLLMSFVCAEPVTVPNTFSAGTSAKASEVNANFTALANEINANKADVALLRSDVFGGLAPLVKDSNGVVIGTYHSLAYKTGGLLPDSSANYVNYNHYVFIRSQSLSFLIAFRNDSIGYANNGWDYFQRRIYYTNSNCTGKRFLLNNDADWSLSPVNYGINIPSDIYPSAKNIVYVGASAAVRVTVLSFSTGDFSTFPSNGCVSTNLYGPLNLTGPFNEVIGTYDLSPLSLVPPFSVH